MNSTDDPNLFEEVHELRQQVKRYKDEAARWHVQNEELRKIIVGHEAKTRIDVKRAERLQACEDDIKEIIRLLRRNNMHAWADSLDAKLEERR